MKLTHFIAVVVFSALPLTAQAQQNSTPKPTVAAAQKVVSAISADKAKLKTYCDMSALAEQIEAAEEKKDTKTVEALSQKMDSMAEQLGPDYIALMEGVQNLEEKSKVAEAIYGLFDTLDEKCAK